MATLQQHNGSGSGSGNAAPSHDTEPSLFRLQAIDKAGKAIAGVVEPVGLPVIELPWTPLDGAVAAQQGQAVSLAPVMPPMMPASALLAPGSTSEVPFEAVAFPPEGLCHQWQRRTGCANGH